MHLFATTGKDVLHSLITQVVDNITHFTSFYPVIIGLNG